jgi:hypothetical protein
MVQAVFLMKTVTVLIPYLWKSSEPPRFAFLSRIEL